MKTTLALAALVTAFSAPVAFATEAPGTVVLTAGNCDTGLSAGQTTTGRTCATVSGEDDQHSQDQHHDDEDDNDGDHDSGHGSDDNDD